jgi:hypothetical protein
MISLSLQPQRWRQHVPPWFWYPSVKQRPKFDIFVLVFFFLSSISCINRAIWCLNLSRGKRFLSSLNRSDQLQAMQPPHLYGAEVKNEWNCDSASPLCLNAVDRDNFYCYWLCSCGFQGSAVLHVVAVGTLQRQIISSNTETLTDNMANTQRANLHTI